MPSIINAKNAQRAIRIASNARTAYNAASGTVAAAKRAIRGKQRTMPRNAISTTQKDVQTIYSKKKPNNKKLRRAKKFELKVQKAIAPRKFLHMYNMTSQNALVVFKTTATTTSAQEQYSAGNTIGMGCLLGNTSTSTQDLGRLFTYWGQPSAMTALEASVGAPATTTAQNLAIRMEYVRFQMSLTNPSPVNLLYDVYEFVAAQDIGEASYLNPAASVDFCITQNFEARAGTRPTGNTNGITPLDVASFGKYWKLLKKHRLYLGPGSTSEINFSGIGPRTINYQDIVAKYAIGGLTRYFYVVGGIGNNSLLPSGAVTAVPVVSIVINKNFHFRMVQDESYSNPVVYNQFLP